MILYFFDRYWKGLGKASSGLPKGVYYFDDQEVEDVETGTSTFEFFLGFDEETRDITKKYADETFYILAQDEQDETRIWQIIDDESDEEAMTRYFYCEDAGMDLINETLPAWDEPSSAQKAEYYIKKAVYDSGFEIGNNEIANLTRTLSWDGEASALARLQSILTQFDNAEFKFRFDIDESTLELRHKYIDLFKKVGSETGIQLRYGNQVKNIQVKRSKANLVNAYRCYGATPSGKDKPVTLDGYTLSDSQKEINAETGKARFVLSGNILKDTESNAKYSRYLNPNEQGQELGYYAGIYTGTAQTQKGLADEVIRKLKITGEPEINYIVELIDAPRTLGRGDYVFIINDYDEVYLEGRVLQVTRSRSNDTFEITLGDYLIKDSGINAKLQELADKIGSVKDGVSEFVWWAYADDELGNGFSLTAQNKAYTGLTKTTTDTQPTDPSVYTWSLSKGTDGTPGRGISGTPETTYAKSANGTTPPTTGWTATRPDVPAGQYLWTNTTTKYTDDTESTTLIPTLMGPKGDPTGVISSTSVPSNPYVGMLWDNTGEINGYQINTTYRWDGTEWKVHLFSADNIRADTFIGFVFQGVEFLGSKFTTTWSTAWQDTTININGTTNLELGEYTNGYSGSGGGTSVTGSFVIDKIGNMFSTDVSVDAATQKTVTKGYELSNEGIVLTNVNEKSNTAFSGELSAQLLQRVGEVGKILWTTSGAGALMNATDVISPSIPLSECLNGWILEFRGYNPSGGGAQDGDYQYIHLPKHMVMYHSGKVFSPAMTGHGGTTIRKILYVTDTKITGHANNAISPSWLSCATRVFAY